MELGSSIQTEDRQLLDVKNQGSEQAECILQDTTENPYDWHLSTNYLTLEM